MPQRSHRILAALLYSALLLFSGGCERNVPSLLAVSEVSPGRVEPRDVLLVKGEGFVAGSDAVLRFRGIAHQPAQEPHPIDFRIAGSAIDQETIEVVVSGAMVSAMCGGTDGVSPSHHATFRGELEVAFSPRVPGAPPIVGRATNVVLDVFPGGVLAVDATADQRALEWLGLGLRELGASGLEVIEVAPGLPAANAGILVGDVLRSWAAIRLHSVRDIEPYAGQRSAAVTLTRTGIAGTMQLLVDVNGYAPLGASGWSFGMVIVGLLAAVVVLSRTALARWFSWLVVNSAGRTREVRAYHPSLALWPFLIVSGLFLGLATRQRLVPLQLDLAWLGLVASMAAASFGVAAAYRMGRWSLRALVGSWLRQVPLHLVVWTSVVVLVLERGSASIWELAQPQTLDPRSYGAFTSPVSFCVVWSLVTALVGVWLGRYPEMGVSERVSRRAVLARGLGDVYCLLLAAVVVSVFGGGWSVSTQSVERLGLAEALTFQARFTALYAVLVWLRRNVPAPPMQVVEAWTWRLACPLVTTGLILLPVWWAEVWPYWLRVGVQDFLLGMTALLVLGTPVAVVAVRRRLGVQRAQASVNPWL